MRPSLVYDIRMCIHTLNPERASTTSKDNAPSLYLTQTSHIGSTFQRLPSGGDWLDIARSRAFPR